MPFFNRLKLYFFNACALIFYVCEGSSQTTPNQLNMQKSLTHTVAKKIEQKSDVICPKDPQVIVIAEKFETIFS
jgi:hypothetical protein